VTFNSPQALAISGTSLVVLAEGYSLPLPAGNNFLRFALVEMPDNSFWLHSGKTQYFFLTHGREL
jgi:hypothetical protein